jgi:carboxylesterase type B
MNRLFLFQFLFVCPRAIMKTPVFRLLSVLFLINLSVSLASETIEIENGKISGEKYEDFTAYRGIPYAQAPIGNLRFADPKPYVAKWENVREFKEYRGSCAQFSHFWYEFEGNEDCLFLNVFVPKTVSSLDEKVPVIFYIHGGAFMFGASNFYGPENIMESQNMILVTINYRLGVLGFLSTEDEAIPGNFGMKDQVEALKWVQRNIEAFNGDPNRVTIVGYSAGGASVQLHYMSTLSDGLFNNGISHSGNSLDPWVFMENAKKKAESLAAAVDCPFEDRKKFLSCLRTKPAEDLAMFPKIYQPFLYNPFSPFGVVVEPQSESAFISEHPEILLEQGKFKKLPWLLSQTQDECLYPAAEFYGDEKHLKTINKKWEELAPFILDYNETSKNFKTKDEVARKIREYYLDEAEISRESFHHFCDVSLVVWSF